MGAIKEQWHDLYSSLLKECDTTQLHEHQEQRRNKRTLAVQYAIHVSPQYNSVHSTLKKDKHILSIARSCYGTVETI